MGKKLLQISDDVKPPADDAKDDGKVKEVDSEAAKEKAAAEDPIEAAKAAIKKETMIKGKEIIDHSEKQIAAVNAEAWENMGIIAKGDADKTNK